MMCFWHRHQVVYNWDWEYDVVFKFDGGSGIQLRWCQVQTHARFALMAQDAISYTRWYLLHLVK